MEHEHQQGVFIARHQTDNNVSPSALVVNILLSFKITAHV
jgi:hypothetical protein